MHDDKVTWCWMFVGMVDRCLGQQLALCSRQRASPPPHHARPTSTSTDLSLNLPFSA